MGVTFLVGLLWLAFICYSKSATLVLVKDAVGKGAVCLDGSAPGYYIREGSGEGATKWILHLEGGGWCATERDCLDRSKTDLGSSASWPSTEEFYGFLSDNATVNPDFYNWNMVYLMYCDGMSFAGDVALPVKVLNSSIYMRGRRVLTALVNNLLANGLDKASEVILTGCSAGGLATFLNADYVRNYLPDGIKYRAFADAGYFLDIADINGSMAFREGVMYGSFMQNVTLDARCLLNYNCPNFWRCAFAPYLSEGPYINTGMFVANSLYDTAQLAGIVGLGCLPPNCSDDKMEIFYNFGKQFINQLQPVINSGTTGVFIDSCLEHCQTLNDELWTGIVVEGQSMRDTFSNWYFGRSGKTKAMDCTYPYNCNPTCPASHKTKGISLF